MKIVYYIFITITILIFDFFTIYGLEIADSIPNDKAQVEDAQDSPEEIKVLEDLEAEENQSRFWNIFKPDKKLKVDQMELPLRLEAKILGREVINFIRWNRPDIAFIKLSNLIKILPESDETYYLKGALEFTNGNWENSENELLRAIAIHSNHDPALFLLGCVYAKKGDWNKSLEYLQRSVRQAPYSPYYRLNIAYVQYLLGNYEHSFQEIQIVIKQKPNFNNAIILAKHMGYNNLDDKFNKILHIDNETKMYLKNGFPSEDIKVRYVMERFYTFYPIVKK